MSKAVKAGVVAAGIAALTVRYFGTIALSVERGELAIDFYGYVTIWAMLPAISVFLLIKEMPMKYINNTIRKWLAAFSSFSFGIYLIHLFVIGVFSKITHLSNESLLYRLVGPVVIYVVCCACVYTLKRKPILRKFVP